MLTGTANHGFTVIRTQALHELDAVMYHMRHERTRLELVWLRRGEENRTFGIAFPTLPEDDTGVFHILEHSVLCGSERYPTKEPFVELMKTSMNTFLNAMTFPDKTYYPISSRNPNDIPLSRRRVPPADIQQERDLPPGGLALRTGLRRQAQPQGRGLQRDARRVRGRGRARGGCPHACALPGHAVLLRLRRRPGTHP